MDEDTMFTILSHPLRRRILQEIYEFGYLSYSTMATWNVSTGTIYHHLKILSPLVTQNSENQYLLTAEGKDLTEWFLHKPSGKVVVETMGANTFFYPVLDLIYKYPKILTVLAVVLFIGGVYITNFMQAINVGPFLLHSLRTTNLQISFSISFVGIVSYLAMIRLILRATEKNMLYALGGYLLSLVPVTFTVVISYLFSFSWNENYAIILWTVLMILFQLFFLLLNATTLIVYYGGKIYKSIGIVIFQLYFFLFIALTLTLS